jgi:ABC-2 type transport system permease protein
VFTAYPVAVLTAGVAVLIYGTAPRLTTGLSVALVVTTYLIQMLGPGLKWPDWILNLSPFHHVPPVPAEPFAPFSAITLSLLGTTLLLAGSFLFRHRDLAGD